MSKVTRCRQALEAELPSYSGPQLFNTTGNPNSIQLFLVGKNYEKFSTLIIAKALNMIGKLPISAEHAMDPHGGVVPRATYATVSAANRYDEQNKRFGLQGATTRMIHEVYGRVLPAVAAGHCDLDEGLVIVLEALAKGARVAQRWDSYKNDAVAMKMHAQDIITAAEMIEAAGGSSDSFLAGIGITADQLTALAGVGSNSEVSV